MAVDQVMGDRDMRVLLLLLLLQQKDGRMRMHYNILLYAAGTKYPSANTLFLEISLSVCVCVYVALYAGKYIFMSVGTSSVYRR